MKKKIVTKKLLLHKKTIANLTGPEMNDARGGVTPTCGSYSLACTIGPWTCVAGSCTTAKCPEPTPPTG